MRQRWHYLGCEHKRRSSSTPRAVRWAIAHGVCRCSMSHSDRISHGGGMVVVVVTIGRDRVLWQPVCIPSLIPMSCSCSCTCCSFCSFCSWYHLPLSTAGVPHHPTQKERNTPPKLASCKVNCCYGEQMKPISAPPHHLLSHQIRVTPLSIPYVISLPASFCQLSHLFASFEKTP